MELIVFLIAFFVLILSSGFLSGSEAALFSLPITRIKTYQNDPDNKTRLIASLLMHPRDLLVTVFMLNTLVNILLQNVAANIFGEASGFWLNVGVPLVVTLLFGEIVPKYIGIQNNLSVSYMVAPLISFMQSILKPIRQATISITAPISRILFFYLKKDPSLSKEELEHILATSEQSGVFNKDEGELLKGYLELADAQVKELMRPREDIIFYNINEPLSKLIYYFVDQEVSRIPVCDPDLDKLIGMIEAGQFFLHRDALQSPKDLLPLLHKPFYAPESTSARLMLRRFSENRQYLALVVDEYSSISGLITQEDLVEVVVGEIGDLRDKESLYTKARENEIIASGKLELDEFNDIFHSTLTSPANMVTIGGWLIERLGEIPKTGSKYELDGFLFQVLSATPSRINRLYIRKLSKK